MGQDHDEKEIVKGPRFGIRHVQVLLIFFNITCVYMSRLSISVIVVAMTNAATTNPDFPEFHWSEKERSYILSSFSWGYILTQFPAGILNRRFGAKNVVLFCTLFPTILTLLTPYIVMKGSWQAYCAIRGIQGFLQGSLFPSLNNHVANWAPHDERYILGALCFTGANCGNVLAMFFPGLIASSPLGWPGISYISGSLCLIWCIFWMIFGAKNPTKSRFITKEECQYIETSLKRAEDFHKKTIPVPWRAMFSSKEFLTLICIWCCETWMTSTVQVQLPFYMNGVLDMNIKSNAIFSSLPYIADWMMCYVYAFSGQIIIQKGWLTVTAMRKTINSIAMWIPAIIQIGISFLDSSNTMLAVSLLVLSVAIQSGVGTGCLLSTIDLAPNHAGVVMSIANSISCLVTLVSPIVVGCIVTDVKNRSEWQIVFGISALFAFFGNLIYIIFGSSEAQPWNAPDFFQKPNVEEPTNEGEPECNFQVDFGPEYVKKDIKGNSESVKPHVVT